MNRHLYALIKPSGRYNGEKVTKMVKYCLNLILKLESYVIDTETKTWQIVCDNDMLIYTGQNEIIWFYFIQRVSQNSEHFEINTKETFSLA